MWLERKRGILCICVERSCHLTSSVHTGRVRRTSPHLPAWSRSPPQCPEHLGGLYKETASRGAESMQPFITVTVEPGLDQGVPWGRDLYTFVTSAAGHMMRTLQKPRKNRPSKRQVNHRRFLHNMIQRKFADIEAANHRLASALYFMDEQKTSSSSQSQEPAAGSPSQSDHLQDPEKCSVHIGADGISTPGTDVSVDTHQTTGTEKKQTDSQHLWEERTKSQPDTCTTAGKNQGEGRKKKGSGNRKLVEFTPISSPEGTDHRHGAEVFHTEHYDNASPPTSINSLSEDTETALQSSGLNQFGQNNMDTTPPFSPQLSPLSLDSCDFSIQMFTDVSTCTQAERSIADIAGSPWADIMDLFSVGNKDPGGCLDVGACLQSVCARQGDVGQEVAAGDLRFADQSDGFTEKMCEDLHSEGDEHGYEYGYSCHGDQGLTINQAAETQPNAFKPPQGSNVARNLLPTSTSCHYDTSHPQTRRRHEDVSSCMLVNCEKNICFTPFERVAQSFSAPLHNPEHRPIPTPPQEHDWLFPDILKERRSPDC